MPLEMWGKTESRSIADRERENWDREKERERKRKKERKRKREKEKERKREKEKERDRKRERKRVNRSREIERERQKEMGSIFQFKYGINFKSLFSIASIFCQISNWLKPFIMIRFRKIKRHLCIRWEFFGSSQVVFPYIIQVLFLGQRP